ncbi:S-layer homology domain-containing protein [Candidatus Peregrinibacteria bacterium]|nr:S-layer homology domain-containing protein [Candidatus Peregrinibacteria bacterium]
MNWQDINQLNEQKKNELRDMKNREREYKDMQRQLQKAIKQGGESAVPASIKEKVEDFGKAISEFRACVEKAATFQDMDDCRFDIRQPRIEDAASDVWDSLRSVEQLGQSIREIKNFERECKNIAKEVGRSLKEAKRADFSAENLAELEKKLNVITEGCNSAVNKAKELINAGQAEEAWETIDEEFHYGMQDRWEAFKTIRQESIEPLMMCRPIKQGLKDMERGLKDIAKQTDRLKREGKNTASLEEIINKANSIREQAVQLIEKGDCEQAGEILQSAEYLRGAFEREFARLIGLGPILHKRSEEDINQQKELSRQFIDEEFGESKDFQEEIKNRMADMMAQMEKEILNRVMVTVQKVAQETMARLVESAGRVGKTNSVKQLLEYTAKANIEDTKVNQLAQEKADLLNTLAEQKNELEQLRGKNKSLASRVEEIENLAADRTYYGQEAKTLYEQALDITSEGDVEAGKAKLDEAYEKSLNALSKENVIAFTDTPLEEWFSGFVKEAKDEGYVSGKADSTGNIVGYDPGGNVLITEMVKMALEAFDKGEADIETSAPKVAPWAKRYIKKAEELGLNVAENRYRDFNAPATRAEIIRTIIETGGFGTTEPTGVFKDVPKTHPYAPFVEKAYQLGIVGGNPDGTFAPDKSVNRAEVAKIITNALEATKSLAK